MTIETINKRIENATKKLDKLNAKMDRIKKAEASGWETNNPYGYYEGDLKYTQRDIDDIMKTLEGYKQMLIDEQDKASSRNVPILVEFLNSWKELARSWYNEKRDGDARIAAKQNYEDTAKAYHDFDNTRWTEQSALRKQVADELGVSSEYSEEVSNDPRVVKLLADNDATEKKLKLARDKAWRDYKDDYGEIDDMEDKAYYGEITKRHQQKEAEYKANKQKYVSWEHHITLTDEEKQIAWDDLLEKLLQKEWDRKYDKLLNDVIRITGTIDDASNLRVNEKGDLDGYIIGKKGTAKINTFGAGGYNIQCFHYRTKVTRMK